MRYRPDVRGRMIEIDCGLIQQTRIYLAMLRSFLLVQQVARMSAERWRRKPAVAIIGAGIAGVTAAATLRKAGFEADIYEQAPAFARIGAGIQLNPNGMKYLDAHRARPRLALRVRRVERAAGVRRDARGPAPACASDACRATAEDPQDKPTCSRRLASITSISTRSIPTRRSTSMCASF